ncbi:uncharacterized protein EV422DRAFT_562946 [Fimicolochytrium jonesii]|uniref:uncharacterized protein n=1 Tax=Fimicolochytrium jonesii TaxID=1396493 RepID=UPI0022FDF44D|nr:uncharacterized protein EV422DRAFT_562946 [Fimicolochytrium jonesii]KAI8826882.1 hypothetical protein EV422DRAFT_562946 [Fimicolochytrium jonesii]
MRHHLEAYHTHLWGAFYLTLAILGGVFAGALKWQAQTEFSGEHVCLLFWSAADQAQGVKTSNMCGVAIGIGTLGLLLSLTLGTLTTLLLTRSTSGRAKRLIRALAALSTLYTLLLLIGASLATAGLRSTCANIEAGTEAAPGMRCEDGFGVMGKRLGTVKAGVSAAWVGVGAWMAYSAAEWWNWKVASERWW